jgi:hypothetical protein
MPNDNSNLFGHVLLLRSRFMAYRELLEFVFSHPDLEFLFPSFDLLGGDLEGLITELIQLSAE